MSASLATSGFGTLLKMGDGGVGAGTQGSVEWGTSTAKIRIKFKTAGVAGNGKNITVVVSGSSYVNTAIDSTQVSITAPTTATVAQVIAYLYSVSAFNTYWDADYGATPGDGSGTITARTVTATASGTDGTELFTTVAEVKSINGPSMQTGVAEKTHMESLNNTKEFLPTLIDPGELTFNANFLPANASQLSVKTAMVNRTLKNFKIVWTDAAATTWAFAGYITGLAPSAEMEGPLAVALTVKLTSFPS